MAPVVSGVAGLSDTAGVDQRRAVTIATPEVPSREAFELHQLGRGREASHIRQGGGEGTAAAGLTDSATGQDTTPTLARCDGNTSLSLGLMVPMKGLVPYAVRGVCVFLQGLVCTRMVLKSCFRKSGLGTSRTFRRS